MPANGKVFISHAHADNERCQPLLKALEGWGVNYWFDTETMAAGDDLTDSIQRAIAESEIFIRICTPAIQQSYWCKLELSAVRGLLAEEHKRGRDSQRVLINIILDREYRPEPFDYDSVFVNGARSGADEWLAELRRALDHYGVIPSTPPQVGAPAPATQGTAGPRPAMPRVPARPSGHSGGHRAERARVSVAAVAALLLVVALAGLAYTHGDGRLFGNNASPTRMPTPRPTATYTPMPTATPIPLVTYKSDKLRYSLRLPADVKPNRYYDTRVSGDYDWSETISPLQDSPNLKGSTSAQFSIIESSHYAGWSGYAIAHDYATAFVQINTNTKPSAVMVLHKTNADCAQATLTDPSRSFATQLVIGCAYAGRGYYIILMDDPSLFAADQKTFFNPLLDSLTFY
jgi:TIR domain